MNGMTIQMDGTISRILQVRREASLAFLRSFVEGRPFEELRTALPAELEATGQGDAARIVRSFFHLSRVHENARPLGPIR